MLMVVRNRSTGTVVRSVSIYVLVRSGIYLSSLLIFIISGRRHIVFLCTDRTFTRCPYPFVLELGSSFSYGLIRVASFSFTNRTRRAITVRALMSPIRIACYFPNLRILRLSYELTVAGVSTRMLPIMMIML